MDNPNKTSTAHLIRNFQNGDHFVFNQIIHRYGSDVFAFIFRMVKDRAAAEDIYQETWYRALHQLNSYQEQNQFKSWLFRIANNLCLNQLRVFKRIFVSITELFENSQNTFHLQLVDETPLPDSQMENRETTELVHKSVQLHPIKQRQVFLMRIHGDLSFKEISKVLNRPLNTVLTQMRTATMNIKKQMQEIYGDVQK